LALFAPEVAVMVPLPAAFGAWPGTANAACGTVSVSQTAAATCGVYRS